METKIEPFADIMLQHIPVGVALYEADSFRLLSANALFHKYMDTFLDPCWQEGKAIGHPLADWFPEAELVPILTAFHMVADTGSPYKSGEYPIHFPQCGTTYWQWTLEAIRNDDGRVVQLILTALDITEDVLARKRAEELAQAPLYETRFTTEARQKRVDVIEAVAHSVRESLEMKSIGKITIDAITEAFHPMIVWIHEADAMQQALRLLHLAYSENEQEARSLLQYVPYGEKLLVARAYREREPIVIESVQEAVKSGQLDKQQPAVIFGAQSYICIPLWFKDYYEGALCAAFDHVISVDGVEVQTLVACGTHIAAALAHARLHESVRSERTRLRLVLDRLPEGILITEAMDGSISYANEAAGHILGIPYKQISGTQLHRLAQNYTVTGLNGQPDLPWYFTAIRALSGEAINGQETIITRPDSSKVFALSSSVPLSDEQNVITGAVTVLQDITVQKSLEQQKNEFLSIASHELRTPITSIQGFAEILQIKASEGEPMDKASRRAVNIIAEQSQRLTQMIGDMLDLARIEQTQLQLVLAPHNILDTLSRVIESYTIRMYEHELQWTPEGVAVGDSLLCTYDEERIIQVLSNLLNNAIKYSPGGSKIEIGLRPAHSLAGKPREVEIWVRDQGIGIASDELPMIFNRFYRASNLDRSFSGFGIGLFLVKEIISRHSGRVWVESSEGIGSTFFITLPLA